MSKCIVAKITNLKPHPKYSHLVVAQVAGHQVIVGNHYEEGTLGFFIPEGAIVPEKLLREMWLWNEGKNIGMLGGKQGNRVQARERGGVRSEGLFYGSCWWEATDSCQGWRTSASWKPHWKEGDDVTKAVGITFQSETCNETPGKPTADEVIAALADLVNSYREFDDDLDETACSTGFGSCPLCEGGGWVGNAWPGVRKPRNVQAPTHKPDCKRVQAMELLAKYKGVTK